MDDSTIMNHFDFKIIPDPLAEVRISIVCSWGYSNNHFLDATSTYKEGVSIADFRGIIPPGYEQYFNVLREKLGIHIYSGPYKNVNAEIPSNLIDRIKLMSKYKFIFVAEDVFEFDWYGFILLNILWSLTNFK